MSVRRAGLKRGFPRQNLHRHAAALAVDHPHRQRFARLQIGKPGLAQNLDMQENILAAAKDIGKAEALALVEPFDPRYSSGSL